MKFRKTSAFLCSFCLLCSMTSGAVASAGFSEDTIKGTFVQSTVKDGVNAYGIETYSYSDSLFKVSADNYQTQLATASAYLAMASGNSSRIDETHMPDRDVRAFLEDIGFSNIETNADYYVIPTADTMGVACASKTITDENGKICTLLAIAPRSSGYGAEWASNFKLGAEGNAAGFAEGSQKVLDFIRAYAANYAVSGNLKVWISGYSRGGAVANLTAAALIDNPVSVFGENVALTSENIYTYTFEAPMAAETANTPRDEKYQNIYNIISKNDLIPLLAPENLGFDRYGTDHILEDNVSQMAMLQQLSQINPLLYYGYLNGYSPDGFQKRLLGMTMLNTTEEYPVDTESTNQIPDTQAEFVKLLAESMTYSVDGRTEYAETVEPYLTELAGMLMPAFTSGTGTDAMQEIASQSRYGTALLAYLYMDYELSRIPYVLAKYQENPEQIELFFNKSNRFAILLRVLAGDLSEEEMTVVQTFISSFSAEEALWVQQICGDFSEESLAQAREVLGFNISEECAQEMKNIFALYCSFLTPNMVTIPSVDAETGEITQTTTVIYTSFTQENYATESAYVKQHLAACYQGFMAEFLTASGVPAEIIAHQTEETACVAMPEWIENVLLGSNNRTDAFVQDIADSESCGKMATFLGNVQNILYAHSMDTVLAWVRAEDADYADYLKDEVNLYGYRRIQIQENEVTDAVIHGKVYDADGNLTAEFEDTTLLSSTDEWIRIHADWLSLPVNQAYTVEITASGAVEFSVSVGEYSTFEGNVMTTFTGDAELDWSALTLSGDETYTLYIPAVEEVSMSWAGNSGAEYYILSSAEETEEPTEETPEDEPSSEPETEETTAAEPKYSNEQLSDMAIKDYQDKTGTTPESADVEANADGTVSVHLKDDQNQTLDIYTVNPDTGKGKNSAGEDVNLPQTGNNSLGTVAAAVSAVALTVTGAFAMLKSGVIRRRKEEE